MDREVGTALPPQRQQTEAYYLFSKCLLLHCVGGSCYIPSQYTHRLRILVYVYLGLGLDATHHSEHIESLLLHILRTLPTLGTCIAATPFLSTYVAGASSLQEEILHDGTRCG